MPLLGCHMSIAGGLPLAVDRAVAHGCDALQIFSKSSGQWKARALPAEEIACFRRKVEDARIAAVVAHASYLINLATSEPVLRARSIEAFREELERAEALGLAGVVIHPGCHTTGTEDDGLRLVGEAVRAALKGRRHSDVQVILEHTAGQGTALGWTFRQLARILEHLDGNARVSVCLDTCHLWAAGYDIASMKGFERTFQEFDREVGLDRLRVFHLNDSKKPLGSRRDRHEHIGKGSLGLEAFRLLLNDPRFAAVPMLLETPKTEDRRATSVEVDPLDARNLEVLRKLVSAPSRRKPRPGT